MANYTRTKVLAIYDNTNPANGTHLVIDEWAADCHPVYNYDPDTGEPILDAEGNPTYEIVCAPDFYFRDRLAQSLAVALWNNPNLPMAYFELTTMMAARRAALSDADKAYVRGNTWTYYSSYVNNGGPGPLGASVGGSEDEPVKAIPSDTKE